MIHLWTLVVPPRLETGEGQFAQGERLVSLLGPEEKDRYQKIGHEPRRIEYLLGHTLLRLKVAEVLRVKQLPLCWEEGRRPVLDGLDHCVSLTHKNGCVAVALAPCPIGIDLEVVEESRFAAEIVRRFFSEREQEAFLNLEGAERTLRFTQLWSLKEALFKATPHPIETIFRQTEFTIKKDGGVVFASPLPELKPSEWQFQFLNPRPRHLLALVVQSQESLQVIEKRVLVKELTR